MKNRKAVFVRIASRPVPRVLRMMDFFEGLGYATRFVGARRHAELPDSGLWGGHALKRVGPHFPLLNGRRPFQYLLGVVLFGLHLCRELIREEPNLIHSSDFEATVPCLIYARLRRVPIIYNIHDNLAERYVVPAIIASGLRVLEGMIVKFSTVAVVPEDFRRTALPSWCRDKVKVVRNAPPDPGFSNPADLDLAARATLFFGGWVDKGRGIEELLMAAESSKQLSLKVAGEGDADLIEAIAKGSRSNWMGFRESHEVIELTRQSGLIPAFYEPTRPINRYAASNKIAEALAVGRPVVINSELEIAKALRPFGCQVEMPYESLAEMRSVLENLVADPSRYEAMCRAARAAYEELYEWPLIEAQMRAVAEAVAERDRHSQHGD